MTESLAGTHGQLLHLFLEAEWDALGVTRGRWCRANDLPDTTIFRWQQGVDPDLKNMAKIADALPGRTLIDILMVSGYLTEADLKRQGLKAQAPALRPPVDIDHAIATDPTLSKDERAALKALRKATAPLRGESATPTDKE